MIEDMLILTTTFGSSIIQTSTSSSPSSPRTDLNLVPLQLFYGTGRYFLPQSYQVHDLVLHFCLVLTSFISCVRCHCLSTLCVLKLWVCTDVFVVLWLTAVSSSVVTLLFCSSLFRLWFLLNWWTVDPSLSAPLVTPCPTQFTGSKMCISYATTTKNKDANALSTVSLGVFCCIHVCIFVCVMLCDFQCCCPES